MATAVSHEQCPKCAKDGHDNSGDNLARYSDGGAYCFRCGYYISSDGKSASLESLRNIINNTEITKQHYPIPEDSSEELPNRVRQYLNKYSLTNIDISKNHIMWSEKEQRIIFPYFIEGDFIGWQGRDLTNTKKSKWYGKGTFKDSYYIMGNPFMSVVVLVEDIISAIRVGNQPNVCAMPLFGSLINTKQLLTLHNRYKKILIWLDKDKEMYSRAISKKAREMGINCNSIVSELDPKDYNEDNITSFLYT
jgi:hypothetical protein